MQRLQQTRHVLGSAGVITLVVADSYPADGLFEKLWQKISTFEKRFSRFLPDSELTKFNQMAGVRTDVSREFHDLLLSAQRISKQTNGLYNPFVLPALQRAGYEGSWPTPDMVDARLSYKKRRVTNADQLEIWAADARIPEGTALDFGGIGKGYLLDQLAEFLDSQNINNYWLSLGGDIICSGVDVDDAPWHIGVQHAAREDEVVATITNDHGKKVAMATSGTTKRRGVAHGKVWHHLIDPRTGEPAETDALTATVCANSATEADVYAKCLVLLGSTGARSFIKSKRLPRVIMQINEPNHSNQKADTIRIIEMGTPDD